jgi:hypothetical protein
VRVDQLMLAELVGDDREGEEAGTMITQDVRDQLGLSSGDGEWRRLFDQLARLYVRNSVLTSEGFAPALVDNCPHRSVCWGGCEARASRKANVHGLPGDDGSIFFPWIGRNYRPGGVCVAGWNLNHGGKDWHPLIAESVITSTYRAAMARGRHKAYRSMFGYRSLSAAAAVHDVLHGAEPVGRPRPKDLAGCFDDMARVQTVKCAPLGNRSNPSGAMNAECPSTFLLGELQILRPRALIIFGGSALVAALKAIRTLDVDPPRWCPESDGGYGRRESLAPWGRLDVIAMWHPSYARWPRAQEALIADLTSHPMTAAGL